MQTQKKRQRRGTKSQLAVSTKGRGMCREHMHAKRVREWDAAERAWQAAHDWREESGSEREETRQEGNKAQGGTAIPAQLRGLEGGRPDRLVGRHVHAAKTIENCLKGSA